MKFAVRRNVGPSEISEGNDGLDPGSFQTRRPFAVDIPLHYVHCRFVDGKPIFHLFAQMLGYVRDVTREHRRAVATQPSSGARKPSRVSKMVQSYYRLQTALFQG